MNGNASHKPLIAADDRGGNGARHDEPVSRLVLRGNNASDHDDGDEDKVPLPRVHADGVPLLLVERRGGVAMDAVGADDEDEEDGVAVVVGLVGSVFNGDRNAGQLISAVEIVRGAGGAGPVEDDEGVDDNGRNDGDEDATTIAGVAVGTGVGAPVAGVAVTGPDGVRRCWRRRLPLDRTGVKSPSSIPSVPSVLSRVTAANWAANVASSIDDDDDAMAAMS